MGKEEYFTPVQFQPFITQIFHGKETVDITLEETVKP